MTPKKSNIPRPLLILLIFLLTVVVCMEIRFPASEMAVTSKNTASILRRAPQAEITEEDRAMLENLSRCAAVEALLESGESGDAAAADHPELMEAADRYLPPESAVTVIVSAIFYGGEPSLIVNWTGSGNERFVLEKLREDSEWSYYKIYSPKRRISYENWDNWQARKYVLRHRWFSWLLDGV